MRPNQKALLIGWDAADWKMILPLMDAGKMPNVERLVDRGVMGQIATLQPPLSPMLWTSIATGKRPFKHGIHGFSEPTADGLGVQPVTNLSRRCKAVWNILNQNGCPQYRDRMVAEPSRGTDSRRYGVGLLPSRRAGRWRRWPIIPGTVHLRNSPIPWPSSAAPAEGVVGEMVQAFIPGARRNRPRKDRRLIGLASDPRECVSIHSAATWLIENRPGISSPSITMQSITSLMVHAL